MPFMKNGKRDYNRYDFYGRYLLGWIPRGIRTFSLTPLNLTSLGIIVFDNLTEYLGTLPVDDVMQNSITLKKWTEDAINEIDKKLKRSSQS